MVRWIMHVDMDAFYASVEILDKPELKGLPVIVGGASNRGVVSTCSYEARRYGVHSAMPIAQARRLCPQGVYLPVRMERYLQFSHRIMEIFQDASPLVEQLSVDEAFLDITGMEHIFPRVEDAGHYVKDRIQNELGLTASVGIAPNKFLAKLASDLEKPNGFTVITHAKAREFIAPLPVSKIFGIGNATLEQLKGYGIKTIGQLSQTDFRILQKIFGKNAQSIYDKAIGLDNRPVVPESKRKSIGKEDTFSEDLYDLESCKQELLRLSQQVGYRLRKHGLSGKTVTLKIKYNDFKLITRSKTGDGEISCDEDIYTYAIQLLESVTLTKGVRLLGVSVSNLEEGVLDLGFEEDTKKRQRNEALDKLKERFGFDIISRGAVKSK